MMEDVVGSDLETIKMVGLSGRKSHLVSGVFMPTSQRSFSMPVYYRLEDENHHVTMTKLSITQIDRHSYGWTIQDADMDILAKAVYPKEELVSEEPFGLPHQMENASWKLLSTVGTFKTQPEAHFEVCTSPFITIAQLQEKESSTSNNKSVKPAACGVLMSIKPLMNVPGSRTPDSDDDTDSDEDVEIDADIEIDEVEGTDTVGLDLGEGEGGGRTQVSGY